MYIITFFGKNNTVFLYSLFHVKHSIECCVHTPLKGGCRDKIGNKKRETTNTFPFFYSLRRGRWCATHESFSRNSITLLFDQWWNLVALIPKPPTRFLLQLAFQLQLFFQLRGQTMLQLPQYHPGLFLAGFRNNH